jgi:hypothetical protein
LLSPRLPPPACNRLLTSAHLCLSMLTPALARGDMMLAARSLLWVRPSLSTQALRFTLTRPLSSAAEAEVVPKPHILFTGKSAMSDHGCVSLLCALLSPPYSLLCSLLPPMSHLFAQPLQHPSAPRVAVHYHLTNETVELLIGPE